LNRFPGHKGIFRKIKGWREVGLQHAAQGVPKIDEGVAEKSCLWMETIEG